MVRTRRIVTGLGALVMAAVLTGCLQTDVEYLSSDALGGRDNGSAGSLLAQQYLIDGLSPYAVGANSAGTGAAAYQQAFAGGTNIVGIIPGTDLAGQYVMVGAHYDGHGHDGTCAGKTPADSICNGASDNATGVAVVLNLARQLATGAVRPRRSVILALWDREEDGLLGSMAYVANPLVPLAATVAYVNLDIQGTSLLPSESGDTFAIGAETGGPVLVDALGAAAAPGPLTTRQLSLVFGESRSDHAVFANAKVPTVFFSDGPGACYHTVNDEADRVDYPKLRAEFDTARRITLDLATRDDTPTFTSGLPWATFSDALAIQALLHGAPPDLPLFSPADQATLLANTATVDALVAAGPAAFDSNAVLSLLLTSQNTVDLVGHLPCG